MSAPDRRAPRRRRSHAERTAETQARIVAAVVDSIAEVGLPRTTAAEVTRRAGVTWGAVQHHFGGKDGMLMAVLADSFRRFEERLATDGPLAELPLAERVHAFVERAWAHFASREYASTAEILRDAVRRADPRGEGPRWQEEMSRAFARVWRRVFGDRPATRARRGALQHYTIAVLSGLASTLALEGPGARVRPLELRLLEDTLTRELADES
ncbi:MAG TPA: TetR/AcrR family transcriptional regulator [Myxococcota bacterium]